MAEEHNHKTISNTALPYNPSGSPVGTEPEWSAGSNVLTSWKGFAELRPGWLEIEDKTFDATPKRIGTWRRWSGDYYVMVSEGPRVWYKNMTTGGAFTLLFTSSVDAPFDFIAVNNTLYFANGTDRKAWDTTTLRNWGITRPSAAPTTAVGAAGALTGTYKYVTAYGSSINSGVSSRSATSAAVTLASEQADVTLVASADAQVDRIHVYRTTTGGDGVFFEITGSPFTNTNQTINDETLDTALSATKAPSTTSNDPPPAGTALAWFANRIWIVKDNKLWYTGWEEIVNGVEEECVPSGESDGNFFAFDTEVNAVAAMEDGVIPFLASKIHKIDGDTQDTFRRATFARLLGSQHQRLIAQHGKLTAWADTSRSIWITDGYETEEISVPIRSDLSTLVLSQASLSFHIAGTIRWLVLLDASANKTRVYDIDLGQWMPPWTCYGTAIHSGEISEGTYALLMAAENRKIVKLTPGAYVDPSGLNYPASATTNLFPVMSDDRAGHVGNLDYLEYESNGILPSSVKQAVDDDPTRATFTNMLETADSPLRTQGTYVKAKRVYSLQPTCRRISVRFEWSVAETPFALYSFDLATKVIS